MTTKEETKLNTIQKYEQDIQKLKQRYAQLSQALKQCEVEVIKTEGKIEGYKKAVEEPLNKAKN